MSTSQSTYTTSTKDAGRPGKIQSLVDMIDQHMEWQRSQEYLEDQKRPSSSGTFIVDWDGYTQPQAKYRTSFDSLPDSPAFEDLTSSTQAGHSPPPDYEAYEVHGEVNKPFCPHVEIREMDLAQHSDPIVFRDSDGFFWCPIHNMLHHRVWMVQRNSIYAIYAKTYAESRSGSSLSSSSATANSSSSGTNCSNTLVGSVSDTSLSRTQPKHITWGSCPEPDRTRTSKPLPSLPSRIVPNISVQAVRTLNNSNPKPKSPPPRKYRPRPKKQHARQLAHRFEEEFPQRPQNHGVKVRTVDPKRPGVVMRVCYVIQKRVRKLDRGFVKACEALVK